jgi:hypothetical protein
MREIRTVSFGLSESHRLSFGTGAIGSIYPINSHEYLITTPRALYRCENDAVRQTFPHHFLLSCHVPDHSLIVGYTTRRFELSILPLDDLRRPLLSNFPTHQAGVFHMFFSSKTSSLVLVGSGVQVFHLHYHRPDASLSSTVEVSVSLSATFANTYETSILNRPVFDAARELLFLPTRSGISGYSLDGSVVKQITKTDSSAFTWDVNERRILSADGPNGICTWDFDGFHCGTFGCGASAVLSLSFLDAEHVVLMNAKAAFFIPNLKTGKSFHVLSTPLFRIECSSTAGNSSSSSGLPPHSTK